MLVRCEVVRFDVYREINARASGKQYHRHRYRYRTRTLNAYSSVFFSFFMGLVATAVSMNTIATTAKTASSTNELK